MIIIYLIYFKKLIDKISYLNSINEVSKISRHIMLNLIFLLESIIKFLPKYIATSNHGFFLNFKSRLYFELNGQNKLLRNKHITVFSRSSQRRISDNTIASSYKASQPAPVFSTVTSFTCLSQSTTN